MKGTKERSLCSPGHEGNCLTILVLPYNCLSKSVFKTSHEIKKSLLPISKDLSEDLCYFIAGEI